MNEYIFRCMKLVAEVGDYVPSQLPILLYAAILATLSFLFVLYARESFS